MASKNGGKAAKIGTCVACGHSHDVHVDGQREKCREHMCPCDRYWAGRPDEKWLQTKWAGRALQPQGGS